MGENLPFHFIYDQYKYIEIYDSIIGIRKLSQGEGIYFDPRIVSQKIQFDKIKNDEICFKMQLLGQFHCEGCKDLNGNLMNAVESRILEHALSAGVSSTILQESDFIIWIGITGQKRSWIEQVQGYSLVIKELSKKFDKLVVIVDGLTSPHDYVVDNMADDLHIFNNIASACAENTSIINVIGKSYLEKIRYCMSADLCIANSGTGSFVPLRICKKTGVYHGNKNLITFPDDYPFRVVRVVGDDIVDTANIESDPSRISYSIDPEIILNEVIKLL